MLAPIRRQCGEIVIFRRVSKRRQQGLMQARQFADIIPFGTFNRLLRQIVAQDQLRIHRLHRLLTLSVAHLFLLQALAVLLVPTVERSAIDKFITQRRLRLLLFGMT
ncbi:hypothetical protein D3C72_1220700 [compost metagenome]